jgi:hypothetical protein
MIRRTPFRAPAFGLFLLLALSLRSIGLADAPTIWRGRLQSVSNGAAVHLAIGESLVVNVLAKEPWNDTHLQVQPGETYDLQPQPAQLWEDDTVGVESDGKTNWFFRLYMTPFRPLRRAKQVPFFALTGQVGKGPAHQAFLIGKSLHWKVTTAGRLYCYANDVKGFYWNNTGAMTLVVTRVKK